MYVFFLTLARSNLRFQSDKLKINHCYLKRDKKIRLKATKSRAKAESTEIDDESDSDDEWY